MPFYPVTFILKDHFNRTTTKRFEIEAATYVLAMAVAADLMLDLDGLTGAKIVDALIGEHIPLVGLKSQPTEGCSVDTGITFVAWLDKTPPAKATIKVPAIDLDANWLDQNGYVNLSAAVVDTFLDDFDGLIKVCVSDREYIDSFIVGTLDKK